MKLIFIQGDILNCPSDMSIAQCVSLDGKMSSGLARTLQRVFNLRNQFLTADRGLGYAVALRRGNRFIINLITKERYFHLPKLEDFEDSIISLRQCLIFNNIREISIPRLGSGLDKLKPDDVLEILHKVLKFDPRTIYMHCL